MITYTYFKHEEIYNFLVDYSQKDPYKNITDTIKRIKYFNSNDYQSYSETNYFFCALENKKIIGMLKLKTSGADSIWHPGYKNWISFCSVDSNYQGKGISKDLISMMFKFAKENNLNILTSGYSKIGWERIRKNFKKYAEMYNVDFLDDKTQPEY